MKKPIIILITLFSTCLGMEIEIKHPSIKERWLAGLYTISKYPFERKNIECFPETKTYLGFDATEKYIVVGTTLITHDIFWYDKNKHLKFYHPESNKLVDPNCEILPSGYEFNTYYHAYDPSNNFSIVGSTDLGCTIFREQIHQVFDLKTGKEIDDIANIRTHYILNRRNGNYHIGQDFSGDTVIGYCNDEFPKGYDAEGRDHKSFRETGYKFHFIGIDNQISNRTAKLEDAIVLNSFQHATTQVVFTGLFDANPCNPRILYKHPVCAPLHFHFISKEGDAFGYYDEYTKELVIFRVLNYAPGNEVYMTSKLNGFRDIFLTFS